MAVGAEGNGEATEAWAERDRAQAGAVTALLAAGPGRAELRERQGLAPPAQALAQLADSIEAEALRLPRIFVLDALVKLAGRRGFAAEDEGGLRRLLAALVRQAGVPRAERGRAVRAVRRALESVERLPGGARSARVWREFALKAAGPLRMTAAEKEKPQCSDTGEVRKNGQPARGVTVRFSTDAAPAAMRRFCEPESWFELSPNQGPMSRSTEGDPIYETRVNGWRRDLIETVNLTPATKLITPLRFTYSADDPNAPNWVHLDYVLIRPTPEIGVDEGSLDVRRADGGRTRVVAKKAIRFIDPIFQSWTTIACDTFWTDTVMAAAVASTSGNNG